uniref:Nucleoside-triphosphatase, cancer-related n=1 Tax=Leptobrachium leishanense TaxID=445787 RepID=A0A8C5ME80_9ANUR
MYKHVFLTGPPGIGKTTLIQKASEVLTSSGISTEGFFTEEVRQGGRRIGFDVVTLSGKRGTLSRIGSSVSVRPSDSVQLLCFAALLTVSKETSTQKTVCVIDEIGKMELFSESFIHVVRKTLECAGAVILGTIPVPKGKPLPLVEEIRRRPDVKVFTITKENRDRILQDLVAAIHDCRK